MTPNHTAPPAAPNPPLFERLLSLMVVGALSAGSSLALSSVSPGNVGAESPRSGEAPKSAEASKKEQKSVTKGEAVKGDKTALPPDATAATYGGKRLTVAELDREIESKPAFSKYLLESPSKRDDLRFIVANTLVNRDLLLQEAVASKAIDEAEVKKSVEGVVTGYGGKEKLGGLLKGMGTTYERFTADISDDFRLQSYLDRSLGQESPPTEEELKKAYDEGNFRAGGKEGAKPPFEQVKADLAKELKEKRRESLVAGKLAELRKRADVKIFIPTPSPQPGGGAPNQGPSANPPASAGRSEATKAPSTSASPR